MQCKELDSHDKKIVTLEKSLAKFDCKLTYKVSYNVVMYTCYIYNDYNI